MEECNKDVVSANLQVEKIEVVQIPHEEIIGTTCNSTEDEQCAWTTSSDEYMIGVKKIRLSSSLENPIKPSDSQNHSNVEYEVDFNSHLFQHETFVDTVELSGSEVKFLLGEAANGKKIYGRVVNIRPSEYSQIQVEDINDEIETQIIQKDQIDLNKKDEISDDVQRPNIEDHSDIINNDEPNNTPISLPKYDKMYIGKTTDGKKIYARVIDFKSADGREITDEKIINEMSCKIKGGLAQIIVSEAIGAVPQEKISTNIANETCSENNKIENNTNLVILDTDQSQSTYLPVNFQEVMAIENNDIEADKELEDVKEILKTLLGYLDLTSPNYQGHQILQKKLRIIKVVNSKENKGEDDPKEYIFTGKMHGSFESGWEFVCQPDDADNEADFLSIQISIDEKSDFGVNYAIEFNKSASRTEELIQNSSDPIEELFKLSETTKINGKKHFECAICKKLFYGLIHFKRHLRVHCANGNSSKSVLKCPLCDCVFSHNGTRTRHIVKVHREEGTVYAF